jgi:hypothetical protein
MNLLNLLDNEPSCLGKLKLAFKWSDATQYSDTDMFWVRYEVPLNLLPRWRACPAWHGIVDDRDLAAEIRSCRQQSLCNGLGARKNLVNPVGKEC